MAKVDPKAPVTNEYLDGALRAIEGLLNKVLEKQEEHDKRFDSLEAELVDNSRKIDDLKQAVALTAELKDVEDLKRRVKRLEGFHSH